MMKKRMLSVLLLFCMVLCILPVRADAVTSGSCGNQLTWSFDENSRTLYISGSGEMDNFYSAAPWTAHRAKIETVTVSEGVTSIGTNAFNLCTQLTGVTLPTSLRTLGNGAFLGCTILRAVVLPEGLERIGSEAFLGCKALTSVKIPASVSSIGNQVFSGCTRLTEISVDASNPAYSSDPYGVLFNKEKTVLLQAPGRLRGSYTIPQGVQTICSGAFYLCSSVTSVSIPASVTTIDDKAFAGCGGVFSVDGANQSFRADEGILYNAAMTALIQAPSGFSGSYTLPQSVKTVGQFAFYACEGLTEMTIPHGVESIGEGAFSGCRGLKIVHFFGAAPVINATAFSAVNASVRYPAGDASWTAEKLVDYDGTLRWISAVDISGAVESAAQAPVTVTLLQNGEVLSQTEPVKGTYVFQDVSDGTYTLRFTQTGMVKAECEVTVSGASVTKNVTLYREEDLVSISHSLDLRGEIGVRYYLALTNGVTNPTMTAWRTATERVENVHGTLTGAEYLFVYNVFAMYMTDDITAQFTVEKDGVRYTLDDHIYSVQTYCENQLRKTSAKSKDLYAKLLNYGAYAQRYFNYRTDDLANANLTTLGYPVTLDTSAVSAVQSTEGTDFAGKVKGHFNGNTLLLEEALGIRYYMVADEAVGDVYMAYRVQGTGEWQYVKAELAPNGSEYFADIKNIPSYDIKNVYEAYFCEKTGNTYTQITQTKTYGAEVYAYKKLSGTNESLRSCVIALMMYADAARDYFGK